MKLSDKQLLLSYFKTKKDQEITTVCTITGISFVIKSPFIPSVRGYAYSGLSPLANKEAAEQLALCRYSEAHYDLSASVLAGTMLSLLHHYELRHDKLSAVEANMVLSQLPLFFLSTTLNFLANLTDHELRRIPHLSFYEAEPSVFKNWYLDCRRNLDITDYAPIEASKPKIKTKGSYIDNSVAGEDRKHARTLLKNLKADSILPIKLCTIITMSIQKNNLAMISPELRKNIVAGLEKLGTADCLELAEIFVRTGKNLTQQEAIISKSFEEPASAFASISNAPSTKLSLAEIIAKKKQEAKEAPLRTCLDMIREIEAEQAETDPSVEDAIEEEIEEEFLKDTESVEALMAEAGLTELDITEDLHFQEDSSKDYSGSKELNLDSLFQGEEDAN